MTDDIRLESPDDTFQRLLEKGGRSQKRRNLQAVHRLCSQHFSGGLRDFSFPVIGKLCEEAGIFKARILYNSASEDYRSIIGAWAARAGPPHPKVSKSARGESSLLDAIIDPAVRAIVQGIVIERDTLRQQVNTLKANANLVIDRRPLGASIVGVPESTPVIVIPTAAKLTESEREALTEAISPDKLRAQGWEEVALGEIVNNKGRTIFGPGFATGLRKILND